MLGQECCGHCLVAACRHGTERRLDVVRTSPPALHTAWRHLAVRGVDQHGRYQRVLALADDGAQRLLNIQSARRLALAFAVTHLH